MRHSIEPTDKIHVTGYGFSSFAKNMGANTTNVAKNLCNKYSQKGLDSLKKEMQSKLLQRE